MLDSSFLGKDRKEENYIFELKGDGGGGEYLVFEIGVVLFLVLGLVIIVLLFFMVVC